MTDDPQDWPRVKEIFYAALAHAPNQRATFLRAACGDDAALGDEVTSLLAAHAAAGTFAEGAAIDALGSFDSFTAPDNAAPALKIGLELGPYRILAPLDAGGMGEVYRALDTRLHREVAVKVLPAARSDDPDRVARLQREGQLLAGLNHPHIATIHGLEISAGRHAIVMELIEGPTLADRLASGPLGIGAALDVARQVAEALEAAHERGVIHRDLKPANVKFTATETVKVLDFGLAKAITADEQNVSAPPGFGDAASSRDGVVMGTPGYMSPEQARGERLDGRSDVWAFGCIVYEMLTAHPAFVRVTATESLTAIVDREPDWQRLPPRVPINIRRLLRRCLEPDPRRRLHHIADARIEIEETDASEAEASAVLTRQSRRRERVLGVSAAALALALVVAFAAWILRPPPSVSDVRVVDIATPRTPDPWSFAISPDGRRLAFVADHDGQPTLWVRAFDAADARVLPGTEGARRPFWSPDSRSIGFFLNSELKRIDARGGSAQTVTYVLAGTTAAWGADGTMLFSSTASTSLRRVNATGGAVEIATIAGSESTGHRHPQFLPDGRRYLFFVGGPDAVRGVYLGALGSSQVKRLLPADTQGAYLAPGWLLSIRQGTLWAQRFDLTTATVSGEPAAVADSVAYEPVDGTGAFSVSNSGVIAYRAGRPSVTRLSWFDRSGRALGTLGSTEQVGLTNLRLSPDGRRVAAERSLRNETDLWQLDETRQTRLTRGSNGSLTRLPVWSPDGGRIAFESVRSGSVAISVKSSTGDGAEDVLVDSPDVKIPCDWSRDGRFLIYYIPNPKSGTDLWVVPLETRVPSVFLQTEANELWGQFSPDGRWIAYQSNETGRYEIYIRPFSARGGATPVSIAGGVYPRWDGDGKELYFLAPDAKMMSASIRATATTIDVERPAALFQTRKLGGGLNMIGRGHQYDVTGDGRFLINVDAESNPTPITLLLNWKP